MSEPLRVSLFMEDGVTRVEPIADCPVELFTLTDSAATVLTVPIKVVALVDERQTPDV
jgi:hypothetical protein